MFFFDLLLMVMGVLLSVAFVTLMERKVMGYMQFRKGPSKVLIFGLFQPFSDAVKLFSKFHWFLSVSKFYLFVLGPLLGIFMMLSFWLFYPNVYLVFSWNLEMLFYFSLMGLMSYFLFFCGFSSISSFSIMGFIRSVSQSVSYEVCVILFMLLAVFVFSTLTFTHFRFWESGYTFFLFVPVLWSIWMFMSLSETNRAPFDFSEGESELVSGFNVEYFGGLFSIIFIVEYGMLVFMSFISSLIFFSSVWLVSATTVFLFVFVWCRSSFPRFRYDKLMEFSWLSVAPLVLIILLFIVEFFLLLKSQYS